MTNHLKGFFTSIGLVSFLMMGFQNCGEQPIAENIITNEDGLVQIVDQWGSEKVSFFEKTKSVDYDSTDVDLQGFCHRDNVGESLRWAVVEDDALEIIAQGVVQCERAGFQMKISSLDILDCRRQYEVYIESSEGDEDMMLLHKNCN
ncbi:MAG: hypothetical protein CL677_08730 [Bdellovibrionaceae bacterium]|nr:hypothetical protein [Pseudobdellovibrionaceae bacterium]|tara:strand:- start:30501 stop:30941 length:441 start_codon:yes stop_codon:yes gene_type:complete